MQMNWVSAVAITSLMAIFSAPLHAQSWPQRPVRLVVPIGAGSGPDVAARLFAEQLAERWRQPVVVENRPGADGLIGATAFAHMSDDHALLFSPAAPVSVFPVIGKVSYDPARDIVPIAAATDTFLSISATVSLPVDSLAGLVALARSQPGKLTYNPATGALPYVFRGFLKSAGIEMLEVPYRELNLAFQDHAQGRVQVMMAQVGALLPQVKAGKVRYLAITNKTRAPLAPDIPTAVEAGYPDLQFEGLLGFFGTRGLTAEGRDRIAKDVQEIAADQVTAKRLVAIGQVARGGTPAQFSASIEEQRSKIASIVKLVGIMSTH